MIDRKARNEMLKTIDEFMDDKIDSCDFDIYLDEIDFETKDETIQNIRPTILLTYDFLILHKIDVDLPKWKFLNRVRLLLQSDAELRVEHKWIWTWRQAAALLMCGFMLFSFVAFFVFIATVEPGLFKKFGPLCFFLFWVVFGWISVRIVRTPQSENIRLIPFDCVRDILAIRRSVPTFFKKPYPDWLAIRTHFEPYYESPIRTKPLTWLEIILCYFPFVLFSPAILLYCSFPQRKKMQKLVFP